MGAGCSRDPSTTVQPQTKRAAQPKSPVLLFYLPSNIKDTLTRLISSHLITSETATQADRLNIRFIDVPNQRSARRLWPREFTTKDYAASLYVADIRERATMLINARTLNWFLKHVLEKYNLTVVVICSNDMQLKEFQDLLSPKVDLLVLSETRPETVFTFVDVISNAVSRYNERRRQTAENTRNIK